jgi:Beta propeller domain
VTGAGAIGLLTAGVLILTGCSGHGAASVIDAGAPHATDVALARFTSCADALANLRAAANAATTRGGSAAAGAGAGTGDTGYPAAAAQGANGNAPGADGAAGPAAATAAGNAAGAAGPSSYSGTNTASAGVDEPDLVKSDGQHIVTVMGNVLRVVDARTRQVTGVLDLTLGAGIYATGPASLLVAGNQALVIFGQNYGIADAPIPSPSQYGSTAAAPILGPQLELIDLSGVTPRVLSEYTMDGALVDARQVGSIVRVVVHSAPRLYYAPDGYPATPTGAQQSGDASSGVPAGQQGAGEIRAAVGSAAISAWLPRFQVTDGRSQRTGLVDCKAVSHPVADTYSGMSMLTVLTFDLTSTSLGDGQPVTVIADGDTVYSDGASLFIANDRQWAPPPTGMMAPDYAGSLTGATASAGVIPPAGAAAGAPASGQTAPASGYVPSANGGTGQVSATAAAGTSPQAVPQQYTGLYKFDISEPGRPVYEASGAVPGWLLGSSDMAQYSLSQWNGSLRVATTSGGAWVGQPAQSAVYVLQQVGNQLVTIGKVGGLGYGEQINAVRFVGPVGYVVTFRQVDPLYTLDLSDPAQPRVAGQLLLSGYSAYLHPIDSAHLIGVGQDAGADGQTLGTQISLFDVSDMAAPVRLAVFRLPFAHSEAEFDPHAFLYWPATKLLVIPVQLPGGVEPQAGPGTPPPPVTSQYQSAMPVSEAIVLYVGDHSITEIGTITQPATPGYPVGGQIRRSLVAAGALWTLSAAGLKANDLATLAPIGWVPFS